MRLLHRHGNGEISLIEFIGKDVPPYAILSHTWGTTNEEVSFADFSRGSQESKVGYSKILNCGIQAARDGMSYFWVDTCCINKESSAELSEAINSMYDWYGQADACYAFLSDVTNKQLFCDSRWFERGWTLQELLAPADLLFFDANWSPIGFKTSLTATIARRTGISSAALRDGSNLDAFSVAEKMSWAASRQTTRVEDEAYCLLGLFDINMPLIYGEGRKAFVRLQQELLRKSDDASMFAYISVMPSKAPGPTELRITQHDGDIIVSEHFDPFTDLPVDEEQIVGTVGLYSTSPGYFREASNYVPYSVIEKWSKHRHLPRPTTLDGRLVRIQAAIWRVPVQELKRLQPDSDIQAAILEKHGIKLTTSSLRKLKKCAQAVNMTYWRIAFLNCRRRDGGIVGILLQEGSSRSIYTRQHFPSLIETVSHSSIRDNNTIEDIGPIFIEGDALRIERTGQVSLSQASLLQPASIDTLYNQTILRTVNLHEYGITSRFSGAGDLLQRARLWHKSDDSIPLISLAAQLGYQKTSTVFLQGDEQGVICKLFPNDRLHQHATETKLEKMTSLASHFIPSYRGLTICLAMNEKLRLVLRSQMQWKREDSVFHGERMKKQCLLSMTIERTTEATSENIMLEDAVFKDALLNALGRHFVRSPIVNRHGTSLQEVSSKERSR